jgi:hypothetical protein
MTNAIALSKPAPPHPKSESNVSSSKQNASLKMYEPKPDGSGTKPGGQLGSIDFQFNPKEVTISKTAKWDRSPTKGSKKSGPPQFIGPEPCKLTLEMFFDAGINSEQKVVENVEKLFSCCIAEEKTLNDKKPMPPLVQFEWGGIISFPAYVSQVNVKYTRFASNGVPIRAVCTVNLEEMPPGDPKQNPTSGVLAVERVHTMVAGDHLALVAYKEYGSAGMWRPLAAYNGIDDPMRIADGTQILLPAADALPA